MLLDQQVPMEWAFRGPLRLKERLGGTLDAGAIAAMPVDDVVAVFSEKPALHRFPGAMAKRTHALCAPISSTTTAATRRTCGTTRRRAPSCSSACPACPASAPRRPRSSWRCSAKRLGVRPPGWEEAARPFSDATPRSVADIDSAESLARVREWKQAQKAQGKSKAD